MKNKKNHEKTAVILFIAAVMTIVGWAALKEPQVVSYATLRNSIDVINEQSYTSVGEEWIIRFSTVGEGELEINEVRDSFYYLSEPEISCEGKGFDYELKGIRIIVKDYKCDGIGLISMKIKREGIQKLRINFGDELYVTNIGTKKENI